MRHFLGTLAGLLVAGLMAAVLPFFAKPSSGGTGFSGSELKVLPIIFFFIASYSVSNALKKQPPPGGSDEDQKGKG
jgi:hypothetical protein